MIVLVAAQQEAYYRLTYDAAQALAKIGVRYPTFGYMGSYALVGYTGQDKNKQSWITQVENQIGRGPSVIYKTIYVGGGPVVPPTRPPTPPTRPPPTRPPVGKCILYNTVNK